MKTKEFCITPADLTVHPELKKSFGYCFYKVAIKMRANMDKALQEHNLLIPQLAMMRILDSTGPTSQMELGKSMNIDKTSMVKFIDGLEKNGYVIRKGQEKDRRVKLIALTPAGNKMLDKTLAIRMKIEKEFLAPLTQSEVETLKKIIAKLLP